jgi:hypothetical protein
MCRAPVDSFYKNQIKILGIQNAHVMENNVQQSCDFLQYETDYDAKYWECLTIKNDVKWNSGSIQ